DARSQGRRLGSVATSTSASGGCPSFTRTRPAVTCPKARYSRSRGCSACVAARWYACIDIVPQPQALGPIGDEFPPAHQRPVVFPAHYFFGNADAFDQHVMITYNPHE